MLGFLKSLLQNAALALALFATASLLWSLVDLSFDSSAMGFPFSFYVRWGPCPHGLNCATFYNLYLILDLIIWYIISEFVLSRFQKR